MHVFEEYKMDEREAIVGFMKDNSFAIIVSTKNGLPVASHLPFHVEVGEDCLTLTAHFARVNRQWKDLAEVLVIFSGPHAYISPSNYDREENVPTWNYVAVHAYGEVELVENEAEGISILEDLIRQSEPAYLDQWERLSDEYRQRLFKGIVPFRVKVTSLKAQHKMSQNKTADERECIIRSLENDKDAAAQSMAAYMRG